MKVFIETYGCSANVNDSEIMAGLLAKGGHEMVAAEEEADAIVVNTCTVKGPTEAKIRSRIRQLQGNSKRLIVAGCMAEAQTAAVQSLAPGAAVVGTHRIDEIVTAVEGRNAIAVGKSGIDKASLPRIGVNKAVSIIQVNDGCLGSCTFCITKSARGSTFSYPMGSIRNAAEEVVANGAREVWLTSQDTGTYGLDRRTNLPQLLQQLCDIEGDFRIRVGMMNPTLANHLLQPMAEAFKDEKVFKFLHIPLQAGSNKVLAAMKRGYAVETFRKIVCKFREQLPQVTIATDIICGFPSETTDDFNETLAIIEETRPDVVNVSRFWPRPGTAAAAMKRLPDKVVMGRSRKAHALAKEIALENNRRWVGWRGSVVVSELGKVPGTFVARNFAYKPIVILSKKDMLGKSVAVEITGSAVTYLQGEPAFNPQSHFSTSRQESLS
ncbi:tRNA (N(6)-L-threonylcarbamoyladenosine(37)-C(2))-methylthiotransferase [Candidatus Woesearchaeota archaeon]|nr:tRNA (N(6)-L-threonylcarbamoyladenosine(37)-C(2))-methylthiotransferase [Candidatus Woesearchaeota archaeon]